MSHETEPYNELADGSRWYFGQPPDQLDIGVVAAGLAQLARWGGQGKLIGGYVYNVAQHSVKVSMLVDDDKLAGLMNDAHEIILGDLCTPMKQYLRGRTNAFKALDIMTAKAFAEIFGTEYPMLAEVKKADVLIGLIESFDLMYKNGRRLWWTVGAKDAVEEARELYISRPELRPAPWSPYESEVEFFIHFAKLGRV